MEGDDAIDDRAQPETASERATAAPAGRKTRRLDGVRIFSSASDAPRSRRPTDGILLALAILGGVILSYSAPGPTAFDTAATDLVAQLPDLAGWFWEVTYDLLIIWSLCLLLLSLFTPGRKRLFLYEVLAVAVGLGFAILAGAVSGIDPSKSLSGLINSTSPRSTWRRVWPSPPP